MISDGPSFFNDKDSITADSTDSRLVYALWDRLDNAGRGPTYFSRTTDGGATWEVARSIYDPGANSQTINNQVVVLPDGTLIDFFTRLDTPPNAPATATLAIIRSPDKGMTWSAPIVISPVQAVGTFIRRSMPRYATVSPWARLPPVLTASLPRCGRTRASAEARATAWPFRARSTEG